MTTQKAEKQARIPEHSDCACRSECWTERFVGHPVTDLSSLLISEIMQGESQNMQFSSFDIPATEEGRDLFVNLLLNTAEDDSQFGCMFDDSEESASVGYICPGMTLNTEPVAEEEAPEPSSHYWTSLRTRVTAMRAFKGVMNTLQKNASIQARKITDQIEEDSLQEPEYIHKQRIGPENPSLGLEIKELDTKLALLKPESHAIKNGIDEALHCLDEEGMAVFTRIPSLETAWNLPDLTLIFRPPSSLMEAMAIGISPGKWIKIAPEAPNQFFNEGKANWKMLQSVVNTGIAFKLVAKIAGQTNEREAANRRAKVQHDVEHFKSFLLNITRAWEDLMHTEEETAPEVFERTTSEAVPVIGIPEREPFVTKAIATGLCKLFPRLVTDHDTVLDMDLLAFHPHYPWPMSNTSFQVMEAVQMGKKGARSSGKKQLDSCTFRMRTPGCDQITIRIWANGKTQTYGCKDRAMLEDANQCLASFIRHIDNYHRMSGDEALAFSGLVV
eukprot:747479-Hanusia_phi.AAC.3